jgi:hypothetical protein
LLLLLLLLLLPRQRQRRLLRPRLLLAVCKVGISAGWLCRLRLHLQQCACGAQILYWRVL